MAMQEWAEQACEQIDAGFFSGDSFHNHESLDLIEEYIQRWQREIHSIRGAISENPGMDKLNDREFHVTVEHAESLIHNAQSRDEIMKIVDIIDDRFHNNANIRFTDACWPRMTRAVERRVAELSSGA